MTSGSQPRATQLDTILVKCRAYIHSSSSPQLLSTSLALFRACMLGGRATELLDAAADMRGKGSAAPRMGEPNTMLPSTATWAVSSSLAGLCWLPPKMLPPCTSRRLTAAPGLPVRVLLGEPASSDACYSSQTLPQRTLNAPSLMLPTPLWPFPPILVRPLTDA